jgi:hypothetical protein
MERLIGLLSSRDLDESDLKKTDFFVFILSRSCLIPQPILVFKDLRADFKGGFIDVDFFEIFDIPESCQLVVLSPKGFSISHLFGSRK